MSNPQVSANKLLRFVKQQVGLRQIMQAQDMCPKTKPIRLIATNMALVVTVVLLKGPQVVDGQAD